MFEGSNDAVFAGDIIQHSYIYMMDRLNYIKKIINIYVCTTYLVDLPIQTTHIILCHYIVSIKTYLYTCRKI